MDTARGRHHSGPGIASPSLKLSAYDQASQPGSGSQRPSESLFTLENSAFASRLEPGHSASYSGQEEPSQLLVPRGASGRRTVSTMRGSSLEIITEVRSWEDGDDLNGSILLSQRRGPDSTGGCWSWLRARYQQALRRFQKQHREPTRSSIQDVGSSSRSWQEDVFESTQYSRPDTKRFFAGDPQRPFFSEPSPQARPPSRAGPDQQPTEKEATSARDPNKPRRTGATQGLTRSNGQRQRSRARPTSDQSKGAQLAADLEIRQKHHDLYAGVNWQHPFFGL